MALRAQDIARLPISDFDLGAALELWPTVRGIEKLARRRMVIRDFLKR